MRIKFVKLKNFKSYPDQETELELDFQGVKLIVGENGAGKTTFFDAIIWGIYGKSMALADDVINWQTGKDCKVEVGFTIGGDSYSIVRYRNHEEHGNKLLFFKNKKNISSRTKGDTQSRIDDTIQISYTAMISSVILSSELYSSFLRSKPSERLRSFESILSLKDVNDYVKKLKKLRDPLLEEIQKIETELVKNKSSHEALSSTIEEYNDKIKSTLLSLKNRKMELKEKVMELEKRINEFREIDVDNEIIKNQRYDDIIANNKAIKETIEKENARLKDITTLSEEYNSYRMKIEELKKIDIVKELKFIDDYEEKIEKNKKYEDATEKIKSTKKDSKYQNDRVNELKEDVKEKFSELKHLKEHSDICPVCNQQIDKELNEKLVEEKQESIKKSKEQIAKLLTEIEEIDIHNKKADDAIKKLEEKIVETGFKTLYSREYLNKISTEIKEAEAEINSLLDRIKNAEEYNKEIKERIKDLENQIIEPGEEPEHHTMFLENLKKKINELELEAEEMRNEIIVIDTQAKSSYDKTYVEETKKKIIALKKKVTKLEKKLTDKKNEDGYFSVLSQVFSNKDVGFKKFFINKMIKIFNERVNFYIPFFFDDDIKITFDKDLNEKIIRNKREVNFGSFSSGEKTRFELAISFAMFMMVKTFFSSTVNVLVFDEILDRNLDKRGFNSVFEILENIGKTSAIFVVSHQEFYKDKFKHHIQVKLNSSGFSYIHKEV